MPDNQSSSYSHGAYIRARRKELGLSQSDVARTVHVTSAMVSRIESGDRRGRPLVLRALAEALQVPSTELLERAGYAEEARHWAEREAAEETDDPLVRLELALRGLPLRPAVRRAFLAVAGAVAADTEYQTRYDHAVARVPAPGDADQAQFATLRALIFDQ